MGHGAGALAPDDVQAAGKNKPGGKQNEPERRNSKGGHVPLFFCLALCMCGRRDGRRCFGSGDHPKRCSHIQTVMIENPVASKTDDAATRLARPYILAKI